MKMKNKYLLNLDYNQEQRKIANAIEQLALLYHMLPADCGDRREELVILLSHAESYKLSHYPDVWRPESKEQEERPWDSEVA